MSKKSAVTVMKRTGYALLILTIALALTLKLTKLQVYALPSTRIYVDPDYITFDPATNGTLGTRFNVTVKAAEIPEDASMATWQVRVYYNDSIINITRWYEPADDPEYVFYDKGTMPAPFPPDVTYYHVGPGNAWAQVGAALFPPPPTVEPFSGDGTLCILEFNITAVPEDGALSCELDIENVDTFYTDAVPTVHDYDTYENGYYEILPEFHPLLMLPILMVITIIAIALAKKAIRKSKFSTVRVKN